VHAIHLYADETAESTVLAGLYRRLQIIRASEIQIAECVLGREDTSAPTSFLPAGDSGATIVSDGLNSVARHEACRLTGLRRPKGNFPFADESVTPFSFFRARPPHLSPTMLLIFRAHILGDAGRLVESTLVPVEVALAPSALLRAAAWTSRRADLCELATQLVTALRSQAMPHVERFLTARVSAIAAASRSSDNRMLAREDRLARVIKAESEAVQRGLFEKRSTLRQPDRDSDAMLRRNVEPPSAQQPDLILALLEC